MDLGLIRYSFSAFLGKAAITGVFGNYKGSTDKEIASLTTRTLHEISSELIRCWLHEALAKSAPDLFCSVQKATPRIAETLASSTSLPYGTRIRRGSAETVS